MSTPLNEEAPDSQVSKDQTIFAYGTAQRDFPQHGSIMLNLHHNNFQSSLLQISKKTAESLRVQLNELLAVPADTVKSVEELDALPVGTIGRSTHDLVAVKSVNGWLVAGYSTEFRIINLPFRILHHPEASDA